MRLKGSGVGFVSGMVVCVALLLVGCGDDSNGGDSALDAEDALSEEGGDVAPGDASEDAAGSGDADPSDAFVEADGGTGGGSADECDPAVVHAALVEGVNSLSLNGAVPSPLVVHGPSVFPLLVDSTGRTYGAAGCHGEGRVAAFGHAAFIHPDLEPTDDRALLMQNVVQWAANREGPTVAIAPGLPEIQSNLAQAGFFVKTVEPQNVVFEDVYVMDAAADLPVAGEDALRVFLDNGGGVVAAGNAWWWSYDHEDVAHAFPANRLFNEAGITWTDLSDVVVGEETVSPAKPSPVAHAWNALEAMRKHVLGEAVLAESLLTDAVTTVSIAFHGLSLDFEAYFEKALEISETVGPVIPSSASPVVPATDQVEALMVRLHHKRNQELPPEEMFAHPAAFDFPGDVPGGTESVTVVEVVDGDHAGLDVRYGYSNPLSPAWHSLGVHAEPGALIEVTLPPGMAGQGLEVAIGAHSDLLWGKESWSRFPAMVRVDSLEEPVTRSANALGGPVYIRVPVGSALGPVEVKVDGAVPMARYVLGTTTPEEWDLEVAKKAPWAEIGSSKFIVTVPHAVASGVEDPGAVAALWDEVMDACAFLAAIPEERERAERIVFDRQISLGWLHSGYPAMGHAEPTASETVDVDFLLQTGSWGPVHELGHNHQWIDTVLPGTTEASVNLWSVYVHEEVFGIPRELAHPALAEEEVATRMAAHFDTGALFENWSVWTALDSYLQLQVAFGWESFKAVFGAYREIPLGESPAGDPARIDEWVRRFSAEVTYDLGPFYQHWGVPVGREALLETSQWAPWLEDPLRAFLPYAVVMGTPIVLGGEAGHTLQFEVVDPGAPAASYALHWGQAGESEGDLAGILDLGDLSIGSQAIPVTGLPVGQPIVIQVAATSGGDVHWSPLSAEMTLD